jgi:iron complex transport system substrate-binding protein
VVGVSQGRSIVELAEGYEDLAESLGAEVDDPRIAENKQRFEESVARFKQAVAAKPGLTAAAVSPSDDLLYVANPEYAPELLDLQSFGMQVLDPDTPDPAFPYWENLSWENADKYQPDLILFDGRSFTAESNAEWGAKQPTWFQIGAAREGAVVAWPAYWLHTYGDFATELDKLTEAVTAANENIGS